MTPELIMKDLIAFTRSKAIEYKTFTGACIVRNGIIIHRDITSISKDNEPLAHAELKVLRSALKIERGNLNGCELYTTQQPCLMCASAIAWSGIEAVYFGISSAHHWKHPHDIYEFFERFNINCKGRFLEDECKEIDQLLIDNGI